MSGHAIFTPATPLINVTYIATGGAVLGAGLAAVGMARGMKSLLDLQLAVACEKREQEKAALRQWLQFQRERQEQMRVFEDLERIVQESERRMKGSTLLEKVAGPMAPGPSEEKGFLTLGESRVRPEEIAAMIEEVASLVDALPAAFREAPGSPHALLARQAALFRSRRDAGDRILPQEVSVFKDIISGTLDAFTKRLAAEARLQQEVLSRTEALLDGVLFYEQLAGPEERTELDSLKKQVIVLLESDAVRLGHVELLEKRLATLKTAIDTRVTRTAYRKALCESVARNLAGMGYEEVERFSDDVEVALLESTLRIPGGERVQVALHQNNQMGFRLIHERPPGAEGPLGIAELGHLRAQEQKWCRDMKELLRRLVDEGFEYNITFEDIVPEQSVKVVVVERPEEILAREEEEERRFDGESPKHMSC